MGLKETIFGKRREPQQVDIPAIMQPEEQVNYNSVLDYLVGLSDKDYRKMTGSAEVYRKANKEVAKIVGIKDEPTHTLLPEKPSDEQIDSELDGLLETHPDDLLAALESEPPVTENKKPQAASKEKKVKVTES